MIFLLRTLQLGIKSLLLHPMRSLLTVLGILIGVAAVIWLLALGEGVSRKAQEQIEGLGADNIIIRSIKPTDEASSGSGNLQPYGITRSEREILADTIPSIDRALPIRELPYRFANMGNRNVKPIEGRLVGCTPEYAEVTRLFIEDGHFITESEVRANATHCVLAAHLAERLFPYEDPIGREVYLPEVKDYYRIVGVLEHRTATAAIGGSLAAQDFSKDVYIPISTMQQRFGDLVVKSGNGSWNASIFELTQVTLRVKDVKYVPRTAELVEATLNTGPEKRQDIAIVVPFELLEQAKQTKLMLLVFAGVVAAISLLVGGIGIMNIMLATVTERTREIGIRRALGAKRADIIRQFLVETIVLSVVGGLAGVILGVLCRYLMDIMRGAVLLALPELGENIRESILGVSPVVVPLSIPLAFGFSVLVGVVFGIYPAMRAAQMDPIEALRHE